MKKTVFSLFPVLLLLAFPAVALADTSVDSTTIVRFYQDDRPGLAKENYIPATQFLGVDADQLGDGNLSLHFYGWGRVDLREKSYNKNYTEGSLTYGYLQYRFDQADARLRAGRFFVNEGIVNEQVDGVSARTDLPFGFGVSAFGGAAVHTVSIPGENSDGKGNEIYGGRVNYRYAGMLELGLSGVYESMAPNLNDPANQWLAQAGYFGDRRLVGGDIWLSPHRMVELMGRSSYNTETKGVAEHSYLLNVKPRNDWTITGEFNEYRERSLFYSSLMFASLTSSLNEKSRSAGGRVSYKLAKTVEVTADYKHYTRDIGEAARFGGDLRFTIMENAVRTGIGYHYLRSGPDFAVIPSASSSGSFHEVRAWAMRDSKTYFAAVDAIGYFFKQNINGKSSAWEFITSLGYHLTPDLVLSGDISYGQNPQFNDEVKGLLRLTFNTNIAGKGGTK